MMEDGTAGMGIIKDCGITIVQDPSEATFPDMPLSVLGSIKVDYSLPVEEISKLLGEIAGKPVQNGVPIPERIKKEAEIAERILIGIDLAEEVGELTPFVCPDCGGGLMEYSTSGSYNF